METSFDPDFEDLASEPERALAPGTELGTDLTITGILGEGGTAIVYSAQHHVLDREVAVKLSLGTTRDAHQRLIREAKMCASVRDAHIPRVYALEALEDGRPYLVMEKVEGEVLTRTLSRWRVPVRYACEIACELLETLEVIHAAGLLHRDVKPSNLMVDLKPHAAVRMRLLDFGVGKILRYEEGEVPTDLTCKGELLGTPLYMAPEQILTKPVDERADLYAAGVVLYEMLAGRTPFVGDSIGEVFAAVLRDESMPLCSVRPELPIALERVVTRAMARDPEARFQSAQAMRTALLEATQEVLAMGPVEAFEAQAKSDEGCPMSATLPMPYQMIPGGAQPSESETLFESREHERVSRERLRDPGQTIASLRTFPVAKFHS